MTADARVAADVTDAWRLALRDGRRALGWDVATAAAASDVPVDAVTRAEAGDPVAADEFDAMGTALGLATDRLPVRPVHDRHAKALRRLVAEARRDGTGLVVPDVAAMSEAGAWSEDERDALDDGLSRRTAPFLFLAGLGGATMILALVCGLLLLVTGSPLSPSRDLLPLEAMLSGMALAAVAGAGGMLADRTWRGHLRKDALDALWLARHELASRGWLVGTDRLVAVEVGHSHVDRRSHDAVDVTGVTVTDEAPDHVRVDVAVGSDNVALRWVRRDDPCLATVTSWGARRP